MPSRNSRNFPAMRRYSNVIKRDQVILRTKGSMPALPARVVPLSIKAPQALRLRGWQLATVKTLLRGRDLPSGRSLIPPRSSDRRHRSIRRHAAAPL
jgi:hypothetical protein